MKNLSSAEPGVAGQDAATCCHCTVYCKTEPNGQSGSCLTFVSEIHVDHMLVVVGRIWFNTRTGTRTVLQPELSEFFGIPACLRILFVLI